MTLLHLLDVILLLTWLGLLGWWCYLLGYYFGEEAGRRRQRRLDAARSRHLNKGRRA